MSAILGILNRSGQPVTTDELAPMMDHMAHYGPDGAHTWIDQAVGLGHLMLHVTPESLTERLPAGPADYLAPGAWSLQITADCRLDNRKELCQCLAIPAAEWSSIADSQLILAAYARWGNACPPRLLGDFAFAIWDGDNKTLFCARDVMGVRAFTYAQTPTRFLFASDQNALLHLLDPPPAVNEPYLKGQLVDIFFSHPTQTLFTGLMQLAPAHSLYCARA